MFECNTCGMIRSKKDLVLLEDGTYMCFTCWNKLYENQEKKSNKEE